MIIIAVGSSLPFQTYDSQQVVRCAVNEMNAFARNLSVSPLYESPAWPDPRDPSFVNAVCVIETELCPEPLLAHLHTIEDKFGRIRSRKNAPRTLDLDLIAYNDLICDGSGENGLILPHGRMTERDFVLAPLCDIAPDWIHPITGRSAMELLNSLQTRSAERIGAD